MFMTLHCECRASYKNGLLGLNSLLSDKLETVKLSSEVAGNTRGFQTCLMANAFKPSQFVNTCGNGIINHLHQ